MSTIKIFSIGLGMLFLSACATTTALDERDPWEGMNRVAFSFNQAMDKILFDIRQVKFITRLCLTLLIRA
ncbi:MAG: hypothetical protein O7D86_02280 [Proteobacteria bacterium]|nr:hypothetical protein [Pseudomonadota bacterium]